MHMHMHAPCLQCRLLVRKRSEPAASGRGPPDGETWRLVATPEELQALIASLRPAGEREHGLERALVDVAPKVVPLPPPPLPAPPIPLPAPPYLIPLPCLPTLSPSPASPLARRRLLATHPTGLATPSLPPYLRAQVTAAMLAVAAGASETEAEAGGAAGKGGGAADGARSTSAGEGEGSEEEGEADEAAADDSVAEGEGRLLYTFVGWESFAQRTLAASLSKERLEAHRLSSLALVGCTAEQVPLVHMHMHMLHAHAHG